ncbi:MAG: hypothetical protein ACXWIO_10000 [Croceibacterium sp.]
MPQTNLDIECDRLSHVGDGALFERLRGERYVGPVLARLVALAHAALDQRSEIELAEEGATRDIKRFILKVHGNRVMAVTMRVEANRAIVDGQAIERGRYTLASGAPLSAGFDDADEQWMANALQELFSRVRA